MKFFPETFDFNFVQKNPDPSSSSNYIGIFPSSLITSASGLSRLPSKDKARVKTIDLSATRITSFPTDSLQGFNKTKTVKLPASLPQEATNKLSKKHPEIQFTYP